MSGSLDVEEFDLDPQTPPSLAVAAWTNVLPGQPDDDGSPGAPSARGRASERSAAATKTRKQRSGKSLHKKVTVGDWSVVMNPQKERTYARRFGLSAVWDRIERSSAAARRGRYYRVVRGDAFQLGVSAVILLQSACIGYGAQDAFDVQATGAPPARWVDWFEVAFCIFFALELLVRIAVERLCFLFGSECRWNIFDMCLVMLSIVNFITAGVQTGDFAGIAAGRILRLTRFFALMRLSRVMRQLPSLRIILMSILDSMVSLAWCFLFIAFFMYVFAVFVVYGVSEYLKQHTGADGAETKQLLLEWWGGIFRAIVTLFMSISGGCDWAEVLAPLRAVSPMYEPLFLFYIFLMCFGVLNVVIGAFVATTQQIAANDPEEGAKYAEWQMESFVSRVRGFFEQADVDQTGTITWQEFRKQMQKPKVRAYFRALDLDVSQAHEVFDLLDANGCGWVSVDEFVEGVMRLRGYAKSIDVNKVIFMCERVFAQLNEVMGVMSQTMTAAESSPAS